MTAGAKHDVPASARQLTFTRSAERKKDQVCSPGEYAKVFQQLHALPPGVEHLIIQVGIPIAYPRMVFLETALESKFNPLVALGKNGTLGLGGFVNKFNAEAELLDDLNDHWTARNHKVIPSRISLETRLTQTALPDTERAQLVHRAAPELLSYKAYKSHVRIWRRALCRSGLL